MSRCKVDTVVNGPYHESYIAAGRRTGHGTAWLWAPDWAMPPPEAWERVEDPPVVALLDTEIQEHSWLDSARDPDAPFVIHGSEHGWSPPAAQTDERMPVGKYYGHGTFIAGLLRRRAPGAQLLSVPVMDETGEVDDTVLEAALSWLADYQDRHRRRMVVLLAFGRRAKTDDLEDDADLRKVRQALATLARPGVEIVASAGNDASEHPRYPAGFAVDSDLSEFMVSVGARISATERAPYSNFGVWVREWRGGKNIVSLMPLAPGSQRDVDGKPFDVMSAGTDNYAWWSGTSFAATIYACERARHLVQHSRPLATPVTAS
jgi:subtilisin family serine protease